jgi:hypothetical protein
MSAHSQNAGQLPHPVGTCPASNTTKLPVPTVSTLEILTESLKSPGERVEVLSALRSAVLREVREVRFRERASGRRR